MDQTFVIRFRNGKFMIGNKIIKIQCDNIVISNVVYVRTPGLWTLITKKNPKEYDEKDYERYKELIYETNMLYHDYDPRSSYPRDRLTKWKTILDPIWEDFKELYPPTTRMMMTMNTTVRVVVVFLLCICRKMIAVSAFILSSVMEYFSHHVHC